MSVCMYVWIICVPGACLAETRESVGCLELELLVSGRLPMLSVEQQTWSSRLWVLSTACPAIKESLKLHSLLLWSTLW